MASTFFGKASSLSSSTEKLPITERPVPAKRSLWKSKRVIIPLALTTVAVGLALGLGLGLGLHKSDDDGSDSDSTPSTQPNSVPPGVAANSSLPVGSTWDYALGYTLTADNANASTYFYSTDLENTAQSDIEALVKAGHFITCYFSAGSTESYRNDTSSIPASAIGKTMDGWPDEKWLDTRDAAVRQVMSNRIALAASKGCRAIDPDNIDGYDNDTGFDLTEDDGVNYIQFLAAQAHASGLLVGLKNGGTIASRVVNTTDFEINEQCVKYDECAALQPFVDAGKPVFHVEYTGSNSDKSVSASTFEKGCASDGVAGFSTIFKHLNLDNWVDPCQ